MGNLTKFINKIFKKIGVISKEGIGIICKRVLNLIGIVAGKIATADKTADNMTAGETEISIKLEVLSDASSSADCSQMFDETSIGDISNDSLNGQEETCSQVDVDSKNNVTADCQAQEDSKKNVQEIMKILRSKQNIIDAYYTEGPTQIKQPDIHPMTDVIKTEDIPIKDEPCFKTQDIPIKDEPCFDFQLNSITGNVLPLDQEVQMLLEMGKATNNPIRFPCPKCNRIYRYAHSLKKHMNVHNTIE